MNTEAKTRKLTKQYCYMSKQYTCKFHYTINRLQKLIEL